MALILIVLCVTAFKGPKDSAEPSTPTSPTAAPTDAPTDAATEAPTDGPTEVPTEPPVVKIGSASIATMGDMLMHMPCVEGAETGDGYDFAPYFTNLKPYIESATFAACNLETTLAGLDNGYKYSGYPAFNCPDAIVDGLKAAGFDMLLTANNHCYDTRTKGFLRTQEVIAQAGLLSAGTMSDPEESKYHIVELDGIQVGMVCYTYETDGSPDVVAPNGITMSDADEKLINSFCESELDTFYAEMGQTVADMEEDGAEAIVLYIHWGVEYQIQESTTQRKIAQKMCDLGVDVIVGGHPHVIQPMELLTSGEDPEHKTVCLYSTGNALSNQRRASMRLDTGHTEDGIVFTFSFGKYSDGTVRVEDVQLLPTWVNRYTSSETGRRFYDILPLDKTITDWKAAFDLTDSALTDALESYDRTMDIVGEGLEEVKAYLQSLPKVED